MLKRTWKTTRAAVLERPVLAVFLIAMTVRAGLAIVVRILSDGSIALDDQTYVVLAEQYVRGETGQWDDYTMWLFDQTRTYMLPIVAIFAAFGTDPFGAQLFTAALGAGTAAGVVVLSRFVMPSPYPLIAGLTVALLPEQVLYSAAPFKDAAVWLALVLAAWAVVRACSTDRLLGLLLWAAAFMGAATLLRGVRTHTAVLAFGAAFVTAALARAPLRPQRSAVFAGLLLVGPAVLGLGLAGSQIVTGGGDLEQRRIANAEYSESAFVAPSSGESGVARDLRHLPRGLAFVLAAPFPWQAGSWQLELGRLGSVAWYPVLVLAIIGAVVRAREREAAMLFPLAVSAAIIGVYALTEGNVGTAQRHRGEVMWAAAILGVVGLQWMILRWRGRQLEQ